MHHTMNVDIVQSVSVFRLSVMHRRSQTQVANLMVRALLIMSPPLDAATLTDLLG
jgi:hypothetical protein